jgi:NadR type nicotinamide-nucleotide adenylyltransferase
MTLGVTAGKFYPFHLGHELLIREARNRVDDLVVLLAWKPGQQVPGDVRASWIRARHPDVRVIEVLDDIPDSSEPWAARTREVLGRVPDVVFTSESYGDTWAAACGARHVCIDRGRETVPVSGTALRADLARHWDRLSPPARAYFARRVSIVGAESSGTTTLARALAHHFQTAWVPEYGRAYWEGRQHAARNDEWETDEFLRIARGQIAAEDDLAPLANRILFCDTDALATAVWHRRFRGGVSPEVEALARGRTYDLTLVTAPDYGFVQDGTREDGPHRQQMHEWIIGALQSAGRRSLEVRGTPESRVRQAVEAVTPLLHFPPLDPP